MRTGSMHVSAFTGERHRGKTRERTLGREKHEQGSTDQYNDTKRFDKNDQDNTEARTRYNPTSQSKLTVVASKWAKVVAGAGSVRSSAGTYTACTEVMEPLFVDVIRS